MIINEDYFDNLEIEDEDIEVQDSLDDDSVDIYSKNADSFAIIHDIEVYPVKFFSINDISYKTWWSRISTVLDYLNMFEPVSKVYINARFKKDRGSFIMDFDINEMNFSNFENMSNAEINDEIANELRRVLNEGRPNWQEDDQFIGKGYSIIFETTFKVVCKWQQVSFDEYMKNMSFLYNIMTDFKKYMEFVAPLNEYIKSSFQYDFQRNQTVYHFRPNGWSNKIYIENYNNVFNGNVSAETYKDKILVRVKNISPLYKRFHQMYLLPDAQNDYQFIPLGYSYEAPQFYIRLKRKNDDMWTFENINEWVKTHFIDRLTKQDIRSSMGNRRIFRIEIYICVGKDTPPRSDNKKTYEKVYENKLNDYQSVEFKLIYYNEGYVRVGKKSRVIFNDNMQKMSNAIFTYENDLRKHNLFGSKAASILPVFRKEMYKTEN